MSVLRETGEGKVFEEWVGEASVFGLEIFAAPVGKALHSKTWLDHCILTAVGVLCRSGRSKWKIQ